jgi:hypothetical protein
MIELIGITSLQCPKGVFADENELQYISALHQTCVPDLRSNGTISATDILIFLRSRYGIQITQDDARDIAFNLCGGQEKVIDEETNKQEKDPPTFEDSVESMREMDKFNSNPEVESSDASNPETEIYFDLVQTMALLLIPEMIRMSQEEEGLSGVLESVFDQLIGTLNDKEEDDLRRTGKLEKSMLKKILVATGGLDEALDDDLLNKMLSMIGKNGSFNPRTFADCLVSDVSEKYIEQQNSSTFFDVFGRNWEPLMPEDKHDENFIKKNTLAFLDAATSSHRSSYYKAATWCLGVLAIAFYWMFSGAILLQREIDEWIPCESFWCISGRKILSFSITVIVVGICGLVFILLTNLGNVEGKRQRATLISIVSTFLLGVVPFTGLSVYRSRMPLDSVDTFTYRTLCPFNHTQQPRHNLLRLDDRCHPAKEWCREHPEVQGQNVIGNKLMLSHEEMNRCLNSVNSSIAFSQVHFCVDESCTVPNIPEERPNCDPDSFFAPCYMGDYQGDCGRLLDTNSSESVCCLSGRTINTANGPVCTRQMNAKPCTTNKICDSNNCVNGYCEPKELQSKRKSLGSNCTNNSLCSSNYCNPLGLCDIEPTICPSFYYEAAFWSGVELYPFCVTEEEFCFGNEGTFIPDCNCTCVIKELEKLKMIEMIPIEEAEVLTETTRNYTIMEEAMESRIAFPLFVSMGLFTVMSLSYQFYLYFFGDEVRYRNYALKLAARSKISFCIENAMKLRKNLGHEDIEGDLMRNYFLLEKEDDLVGGLIWTISAIKSKKLMFTEGVFIPSRLLIANILQILALITFLAAAIYFTRTYARELDEYRNDYDIQFLMRNASPRDWHKADYSKADYPSQKYIDRIPAGWIIYGAGIPAVILTMIVGVYCTIVHIPSYVLHVLMYRHGGIQSFNDPNFSTLRESSDLVNQNLGNIVFSLFGGCAVTFFIVFLVLFLIMWHVTRPFCIQVLGFAFGIGVSAVIGLILQAICRAKFVVALYRLSVLRANLASVFFECWNFSTAVLTILKRIGIVLATAFTGLGRIDIPFLHPLLGMDAVADNFRREVLVHDAHLHPYLDRLSGMYMRRLRHKEKFGSVESQAWRSLFVIGLCPWLVKHRVNRPI